MKYEEIIQLLEKYWEADTTLSEEKALKAYFNNADVDERLQEYKPLFAVLQAEKTVEMPGQKVMTMPQPRIRWFNYAAAASVIGLLGLGGWWYARYTSAQQARYAEIRQEKLYTDTYDDPEKAAAEIKAALALVSRKMNKGKKAAAKGLKKVEKIDKIFHKPKSVKNI